MNVGVSCCGLGAAAAVGRNDDCRPCAFVKREHDLEIGLGSSEEEAPSEFCSVFAFKIVSRELVEGDDVESVIFPFNGLDHRKIPLGAVSPVVSLHHRDADRPRTIP